MRQQFGPVGESDCARPAEGGPREAATAAANPDGTAGVVLVAVERSPVGVSMSVSEWSMASHPSVNIEIKHRQIGFSRFGLLLWWFRTNSGKWQFLQTCVLLPWRAYIFDAR